MNPKVQELIDKKKVEEKEIELKRRKDYLYSLGLIDKNKTEKIYVSSFENTFKVEEGTGRHYIDRYATIEVTDEEYEELRKYYSKESDDKKTFSEIKMRKDISSIKFWVMFWSIFSIVCAAIAFFVLIANI